MVDRVKRAALATVALVLAAGLLVGGPREARASVVLPAYFDPGDARGFAPMVFMRQAPPPVDDSQDEASYPYGPITDSSSLNIAAQNSSTWRGGHNWPFMWANRARVPTGHPLDPANPVYPTILDGRGRPYRVEYTTVERANAATKAQVLYVLGAPSSIWLQPLIAQGMNAVYWSSLNADPGHYFTRTSQDGASRVVIDKMVIPTAVAASAYGVTLDYEVQDDRAASQTDAFLADMGATIRSFGKKAYLYTNPWDGTQLTRNGYAFTKVDHIKANFDYISLYLLDTKEACNVFTAYPASVAYLKGVSGKLNFGQILVTVDESLCTPIDAAALFVRRAIDHFAGYSLFPDGAAEGGPHVTGVNLMIWTLLHG